MALIKCPQCGQTVLSVASKCPKCSHLLLQARAQGDDREFAHCRRCEKIIPRKATICEYCEYPQLARRRIRIVVGLVLAVAVLAAAIIGVSKLTGAAEPDDTASLPMTPTIQPTPTDTMALRSVPVAPPIEAQRAPPRSPPSAAPDTVITPPDPDMRWAADWANVREGPGTAYPVVGILRPGTPVTAASMRRGWWLVSVDGNELGYVARNLLSDQPPTP